MQRREFPQLGETVLWDTLSNGLTVAIVQRPGFSKKLCYFATDFGSIHRNFSLDGRDVTVPEGIAHFLEHKLFDMPDMDVTAGFAALGASPNAFTSYDMTAYHFSCTDHFEDCLALLLRFVSTPYFTAASVEKEQGIIGQEIDMNEDAPEIKSFELLMQTMYRQHPIREPILGSRPTIAQIDPEKLTLCHNAFYRPDNMLLCVVGDVDPEAVRAIAEKTLPSRPETAVCACREWEEETACDQHFVSARMEVSMPMFQLGFKCASPAKGAEAVRREVIGELAAEVLFGEASSLYLQLYEEGLIDASFGGGFETVEGMALLIASGDSEEPEKVRSAIMERAAELVAQGIPEEEFLRMKRSAMGRRIRALDSFDSTAFRLCAYHFSGFDYFDFPAIYRQVTREDVLSFLQQTVTQERCCLCVIYPSQQEDTL